MFSGKNLFVVLLLAFAVVAASKKHGTKSPGIVEKLKIEDSFKEQFNGTVNATQFKVECFRKRRERASNGQLINVMDVRINYGTGRVKVELQNFSHQTVNDAKITPKFSLITKPLVQGTSTPAPTNSHVKRTLHYDWE